MPDWSRLQKAIRLLEKCFVNDESLPKRKRELAQIIVEEIKGVFLNEFNN